jgi:hypothetical protein
VTFYYDLVDVELDLPQGESLKPMLLLHFWAHGSIQVPYVVHVLGQLVAMFSNVDHLSVHGAV